MAHTDTQKRREINIPTYECTRKKKYNIYHFILIHFKLNILKIIWRIFKNNLKTLHTEREGIKMNKLNNRMASKRGNSGGSGSSSNKNYILDHRNQDFSGGTL